MVKWMILITILLGFGRYAHADDSSGVSKEYLAPVYFQRVYEDRTRPLWSESTSQKVVDGMQEGMQSSGQFNRFQSRVLTQLGQWYIEKDTGLIIWAKSLEDKLTWGSSKSATSVTPQQTQEVANNKNAPQTVIAEGEKSRNKFEWKVAVRPLDGRIEVNTSGIVDASAEYQVFGNRAKLEVSKIVGGKYRVALNSTTSVEETRTMAQLRFDFNL